MLNMTFDAAFEAAITTPHEHEASIRPPLWIIWKIITEKDGVQNFPAIDCICNSEESVRYHLATVIESYPTNGFSGVKDIRIFVERIPANHRFASSLINEFEDATLTYIKQVGKWQYNRDGD